MLENGGLLTEGQEVFNELVVTHPAMLDSLPVEHVGISQAIGFKEFGPYFAGKHRDESDEVWNLFAIVMS